MPRYRIPPISLFIDKQRCWPKAILGCMRGMATCDAGNHCARRNFALISSTGERIYVDVSEPAVLHQSTWLEAAVDIGEDEGVVPVATAPALRCLVAYMQQQPTLRDEREVMLPLTCTCSSSHDRLGHDVRRVLAPTDVEFLDRHVGPAADGTWALDAQELLLELLVTVDYIGHHHLREVCVAYLGCRIMSATESDMLRWFGLLSPEEQPAAEVSVEGHRAGSDEECSILSGDERLYILKTMKRYIDVDEVGK